jgi:hypothetical protein
MQLHTSLSACHHRCCNNYTFFRKRNYDFTNIGFSDAKTTKFLFVLFLFLFRMFNSLLFLRQISNSIRHKANLDTTDSSILFNKSFKPVSSITTKCSILSYSSQKKNSIHFVTKPILTQAREEEENAQFSFVLHLKHFNFIPSSNQSEDNQNNKKLMFYSLSYSSPNLF